MPVNTLGRALASVLACVALGSCASRSRDLSTSPPRSEPTALVVTANLTELFDDRDIADRGDLKRFVDRLGEQLPRSPDVLLLQEMRRESTDALVQMLEARFGDSFHPVVRPGPQIWQEPRNTMHAIGIVANVETTDLLGTDLVRTRYPAKEATPPALATNKLVGLAHLRRRGGLELSVASLHFPPDRNFLAVERALQHRARWSEQVARRVSELGGSDSVRVVAGDFNNARCLNHTWYDCDIAPFWEALTTEPHAIPDARQTFKDRVGWRRTPTAGVDHIFTDGHVWNYKADAAYTKDELEYYSDHRFRWALIGASATGT